MAIMPGTVQNSNDEHDMFVLSDLVHNPVGKTLWHAPTHLAVPAATRIQVRILGKTFENLQYFGDQFPAQAHSQRIIPCSSLNEIAPGVRTRNHAPTHNRYFLRKSATISSIGIELPGS